MENFLLPNMIEFFETNRMSHFPLFYDDFVLQKFNFTDWIIHSAVICRPELCKRDRIMKRGWELILMVIFESGIVVRISLLRWC